MKKQISSKKLALASIITSILMISSFTFIYCHTLSSSNVSEVANCGDGGTSKSVSADGLVVVEEADLSCAGSVQEQRSSEEAIDVISKLVGTISAVLNLLFLSLLVKKPHS